MNTHKVTVPLADRAAYSVAEVVGLTGFSCAFVFELMKSGRLRTRRIGRRRIVTAAALAELLGENWAALFGPKARHQQPVAPAPRLEATS